jgi:TonB-dependent receptor
MLHLKSLLTSVLFFLICGFTLVAQTGSIKGTIKDAKTQEALVGATVSIQGTTTGAVADAEGNFTLGKVSAGKHTIQFTFIGYSTKTISEVTVEAGKTTVINTLLEEDAGTQLQEVVVTAQRATNTEVAVITEIKKIEQVAVGISAQQISRSQDRDAAQVMRRVPGVSINDDRFVLIRGLQERYNTVMINDVITPSTEVDVRSFSFDMIPSSYIDRMVVFKSGAGELPGDFGGGVVKIYTKTIPDDNSFSAGFSLGYRAGTTFQSVTDYRGSSTDWLGLGNNARQLPGNFPSTNAIQSNPRSSSIVNSFKALPDYFNIFSKNAIPDIRANLGFSRRFRIGGVEVTNISAANYSLVHDARQNKFIEQQRVRSDETDIFNDQFYGENTRLGLMSNWGIILNPSHKIEFRNLFNQIGIKEFTYRTGIDGDNGVDISNYAFRYENRSIYSGQLNGTHELSDRTTLRWTGGYGYTRRNEPDFRRFESNRQQGETDNPFRIVVNNFPTVNLAARFFSELTETAITGRGDLEHRLLLFGRADSSNENLTKLRAGFYTEYKSRNFAARTFGLAAPISRPAGGYVDRVTQLPPEQFFNVGNLTDSLYYGESTREEDAYDAQNLLTAGYVSGYFPVSEKVNVSLGLRTEFNRQQIQYILRGGAADSRNYPVLRVLPSVNLVYNFSKTTLLRLAYSKTLNRPEFRELAPFSYYDFNLDQSIQGNPDLKTASIHNADIRFEWYPSEGEIISLAGFYKYMINPIERIGQAAGSGVTFSYANADNATLAGLELEVRKSIAPGSSSVFLSNLSAILNASYIYSLANLNPITSGGQDLNRPLQGQSPYLINAGLYYNDQAHGWQINGLYNVIGPRIFSAGTTGQDFTIFEIPRNVIDLNIIKQIGPRMEFKVGVQDLLNQKFRLVQDSDANEKLDGADPNYQSFTRGTSVIVGFNYRF